MESQDIEDNVQISSTIRQELRGCFAIQLFYQHYCVPVSYLILYKTLKKKEVWDFFFPENLIFQLNSDVNKEKYCPKTAYTSFLLTEFCFAQPPSLPSWTMFE